VRGSREQVTADRKTLFAIKVAQAVRHCFRSANISSHAPLEWILMADNRKRAAPMGDPELGARIAYWRERRGRNCSLTG